MHQVGVKLVVAAGVEVEDRVVRLAEVEMTVFVPASTVDGLAAFADVIAAAAEEVWDEGAAAAVGGVVADVAHVGGGAVEEDIVEREAVATVEEPLKEPLGDCRRTDLVHKQTRFEAEGELGEDVARE